MCDEKLEKKTGNLGDRELDNFCIALMILLRGFVIEMRIENVLQWINRNVRFLWDFAESPKQIF